MRRRDLLALACNGAVLAQWPSRAQSAAAHWETPPLRGIRQVENAWIPVGAARRLAVRLWLPESAAAQRVPVVLEYIPYRKRDTTRDVDDVTGRYLAGHGVAFARVDVPGSGDSDGVLRDEYLQEEQSAALTAIDWLAGQAWCTGAVGMRGYSWGAQSALQAAMQNPAPLKAIMPFCASDHRFVDDAHWVGGALGWVNLQWGAFFKGVQASPPDPAVVGPRWRAMWKARLEAAGTVVARWTAHQRDDAYWRNGDVAVDYGRIRIPVYAVGGWVDAYTDSIPRLLEGLTSHRQALIGPWAHSYPEFGSPGPGLDWGHEELRWWYQWLLGEDTGITREPRLRLYMPEATAAEAYPHPIPGRWLAASTWPPAARGSRLWEFAADGLRRRHSGAAGALPPTAATATVVAVPSERLVGLDHPEWLPFYLDVDLPAEQSRDDANSLTFDSEPLADDLELLGSPVVRLGLVSDQPVAQVAVRLNEVRADGRSWVLTYAVLNLCQRNGGERPTALIPGKRYDIDLPLHFHAHRLRRGSRLRIAVSGSLWPLVWGAPKKTSLLLHLDRCRLTLPLNAGSARSSAPGIASVAADNPPASGIVIQRSGPDVEGRVEIHKTWPRTTFKVKAGPPGDPLSSIGTERFEGWTRADLRASAADPNAGSWHLEFEERFQRGTEWDCRIEVGITLRADPEHFFVTESLRAYEGDALVHDARHETAVPRVLV